MQLVDLASRYIRSDSDRSPLKHARKLLKAMLHDDALDMERDLMSFTFASRLMVTLPDANNAEYIEEHQKDVALSPEQAVLARVTVTYCTLVSTDEVKKHTFTAYDPSSATHPDILNRGLDLLVLGFRSLLQIIAAVFQAEETGVPIQQSHQLENGLDWLTCVLNRRPQQFIERHDVQFSPTDVRRVIMWASGPDAWTRPPPLSDDDSGSVNPTVGDLVAPAAERLTDLVTSANGFINDPFFMLRNMQAFLGRTDIRQRLTDDVVEPARQATEALMSLRDKLWHHVAFLTATNDNAFMLPKDDTVRHLTRMRSVFNFARQHLCPSEYQTSEQPNMPAVYQAVRRLNIVIDMFDELHHGFIQLVTVPLRNGALLPTTVYHHRKARLHAREKAIILSLSDGDQTRLTALDNDARRRMLAVQQLLRRAGGDRQLTADEHAVVQVMCDVARLFDIRTRPKSNSNAVANSKRPAYGHYSVLDHSDDGDQSDLDANSS